MATGAQGCTALDLFVEHRTLFRLCDKVKLLESDKTTTVKSPFLATNA